MAHGTWPPGGAVPTLITGGDVVPWKTTVDRAKEDLREGKRPTTAAGEFVKEEIEHVRRGKHGARSPRQAIAIGLSKARRAGVPLKPPKKGSGVSARTRQQARRDLKRGENPRPVSRKRSAATEGALRREGKEAASPRALAYQARKASRRRSARKPAATHAASPTSRRSSRRSPSTANGRKTAKGS